MFFNFKNEEPLNSSFKPVIVQEIHYSTENSDNSIETEIANMTPEQRICYRDHIFENIYQLTAFRNINDPQIKSDFFQIQNSIKILSKVADFGTPIPDKIFNYVIDFASKQNLLDSVFLFIVSSFKQNPKAIDQLFHNFHDKINTFLNRFEYPFNKLHFEFAVTLIGASQQICDELVCMRFVDIIESGILSSIYERRNFSQYWTYSLEILNEITKNSSGNMILYTSICEICFIFLNHNFEKNVVLQSIKCINTITSKTKDSSLLTEVSKHLPFLDEILCGNKNVNEIQSIINLITIISTGCKDVDLFKNNFVQHLIEVSYIWNGNEFEPIYEDFFHILTFVLQSHPKLIKNIKSNTLDIAAFYMNNGGCAIKDQVSLFFSRLCDNFFWSYVSDFFEANSEIVSSLFLMLQTETDQKTKKNIIHALTSLATNIKITDKCVPNTISQFSLQSSMDAFLDAKNSDDLAIQAECNLLNQAVNDLIQENILKC